MWHREEGDSHDRSASRWCGGGAGRWRCVGARRRRPVAGQEGFRFKSGVELINVTATVTDRTGRFASGLRQDDFVVYEDDKPVEITHFSAERTPVSLGIVLDTSGSMAGEKMDAARDAIDRFLGAAARTSGRVLPVPLQRRSGPRERLDDDRQSVEPQPRARQPVRRHGDVRRRGRGRADGAGRPEPQEGDRADLGRQRHQQPPRRPRSASSWFAKPKCSSTRSGSTARANRRFRGGGRRRRSCGRRRRFRSRFPAAVAAARASVSGAEHAGARAAA